MSQLENNNNNIQYDEEAALLLEPPTLMNTYRRSQAFKVFDEMIEAVPLEKSWCQQDLGECQSWTVKNVILFVATWAVVALIFTWWCSQEPSIILDQGL